MRRRDFLWAFAGATAVPLEARAEPILLTIGCLWIRANVGYIGVLTTGHPCSSMRRSLPEPA